MKKENESWLLFCGSRVLEKKLKFGERSLTNWERLVYWLWLLDSLVRDGKADHKGNMLAHAKNEALLLSNHLGLRLTQNVLRLSRTNFRRQYAWQLPGICDELKADHGTV